MRQVCVFLIICVASTYSHSQDSPREQVSIGYSYLNADTNGLSSRQNVPIGLNAGFIANVSPRIGLETNFAAYYKRIDGVDVYDYSLLFGPRFAYNRLFFHALVGMDGLVGSADGAKLTQAGPAVAVGGGISLPLAANVRFETGVDYVATDHNILFGRTTLQTNFRAVASIVFTFGHSNSTGQPVPAATSSPSQIASRPSVREGLRIQSLGAAVAVSSQGAEIVEIAPNSTAALANMHVGDIINEVNGSPVKTPMELAAAMSGAQSGSTVHIGYLIRGEWQSETVILMPQSK